MTQFLPPNLLALFAPRDPIPFLPPAAKLPHEKKNRGYQGVGNFLDFFEDPDDTPPPKKVETREERLERRRRERAEQVAYKLEQEIAVWDPHVGGATTDPYKTLFVARINYDTSESKLRREFEMYGPIKKIGLVHNKVDGKPRGYAFIEYEHERDMHSAYKHADGKKIDGRRVLVDVERGRTVKGWLPRRLGGGLGGTRRGGPEVNLKHSGREDNERERERYRLEREAAERGGRGDRDRDRSDRRRSRSRDRDRERDRDRDRDRGEKKRRSRSRSRDRKRRRSRDRVVDPDIEEVEETTPARPRDRDRDRDRGDRDRDRDRDRRDRDRKRRRTRSKDRDRKRERRDRDRDRDKDRDRRGRDGDDFEEKVRIKVEPPDDYPDYSDNNYNADYTDGNVKYEKGEEERERDRDRDREREKRDKDYARADGDEEDKKPLHDLEEGENGNEGDMGYDEEDNY